MTVGLDMCGSVCVFASSNGRAKEIQREGVYDCFICDRNNESLYVME